MADEGKEGAAVGTSAADLLKHIEDKVVGDMFKEPEPIEPKEDSVKEETPEEPKEETKEETSEETVAEPEKDKVQKRIDELVSRAKTAEEELQSYKSKVEELSKGPVKEYVPAPTIDNPLSDVLNFEELRKREQIAEQVRANCIRNPDGYSVVDGNGKEIFFDAQTVKEALVETDKLLRKDIPNRERWIREYNNSVEQTKKVMPWLMDSRTSEYQLANSIKNNFPDIKKLPQYEYFIGLAILGEKTLNDQLSKSKPKTVESKKVPTPPVSASTSSTRTTTPPRGEAPKLSRGSSKADIVDYLTKTVLKDY